MNTKQILNLEEKTLKYLYEFSIKQKEVEKLKGELGTIEKDMFGILLNLADSINEIIKNKEMVSLRELIERHKFLQLVTDSKKALESVDRDFIENVERRVRSFERDLTTLMRLFGVQDYRYIEELKNIEEKLKFEHEFSTNPVIALIVILTWNSRVLAGSLSSRAVWLSYKKP